MSRRDRIARFMHTTGLTSLVLRARALLPQRHLSALTFHRVAWPEDSLGFDAGVVDATPESFERTLQTLSSHFTSLGVDDLIAFLGGAKLPPNPIVITFDDGYRDNLEQAVPLLTRFGMKAIFFVATDYIERRRLFWWDQVTWLLSSATRATLEIDYPARLSLPLGDQWALAQRALLRVIKDTFALDLDRFLDGVARGTGVEWNDRIHRELADRVLLDWDGVRAIHRAGMDVGSHTRTHRVLHQLPVDQLHDELAGSKALLEAKLGAPVHSVSYPNGGQELAERSLVRQAVRDAGYQIAFTNKTGTNDLWRGIDRYNVRRLCMDIEISEPMLRGMLAMPALSQR